MPVEAARVKKHLDLHKSQIEGGKRVFFSQGAISLVFMYELYADGHWHHVWLVTPFIYDLLYFIFSIRVTSVLW